MAQEITKTLFGHLRLNNGMKFWILQKHLYNKYPKVDGNSIYELFDVLEREGSIRTYIDNAGDVWVAMTFKGLFRYHVLAFKD